MWKNSAIACLLLLTCMPPRMALAQTDIAAQARDDAVNFYCLRVSYPAIVAAFSDERGEWLLLRPGGDVLYRPANPVVLEDAYDVDVATSLSQAYPLEPERPATPAGFAPGRRRSHALLNALYGKNASDVKRQLHVVTFSGAPAPMSGQAAQALARVRRILEPAAEGNARVRAFLKNDGGFFWRHIAGTRRLSPHAYGIAIDLSAHKATYWRWSRARPHPLQRDYPPEIVAAFESQGFIWGGKWHEFDLMHFEYRPELICKARVLASRDAVCRRLESREARPER